jgi:hypothetical protein
MYMPVKIYIKVCMHMYLPSKPINKLFLTFTYVTYFWTSFRYYKLDLAKKVVTLLSQSGVKNLRRCGKEIW